MAWFSLFHAIPLAVGRLAGALYHISRILLSAFTLEDFATPAKKLEINPSIMIDFYLKSPIFT
jgi:hypothetical protein